MIMIRLFAKNSQHRLRNIAQGFTIANRRHAKKQSSQKNISPENFEPGLY